MEKNNTEFTYENSSKVEQTIVIDKDDFDLVQKDSRIHDTKLETKPTTFFKDAMKRFRKNKSSVAGGIILGIIVVLAFVLPLVMPYEIDAPLTSEIFLEPKLFDAGTGWWDGEKSYSNVVYDTKNEVPAGFEKRAVTDSVLTEEGEYFTDTVNDYAYGGDMLFYTDVIGAESEFTTGTLSSYYYTYDLANNYSLSVDFNDVNDTDNYTLGEYRIYFSYLVIGDDFLYSDPKEVELQGYSKDYTDINELDLTKALEDGGIDSSTVFVKKQQPEIVFELKASTETKQSLLIHSMEVTSDNTDEAAALKVISFDDANKALLNAKTTSGQASEGYWTVLQSKVNLSQANIIYADFKYDTYELKYGEVENQEFGQTLINSYIEKGYMELDLDDYLAIEEPTDADLAALIDSFVILDDLCPIRSVEDVSVFNVFNISVISVFGTKSLYRALGYSSMPKFLLGTDSSGHDLVKSSFAGLRISLALGIITSAICFAFGLVWGSISGYFGGNVDIIMERFCDVLGGVPWIVVMTLCIINLGSNLQTFALALCLTGWMGTSARTRTQFYRFKGREYILAARTLGASDTRLIFRHILPNAMGTIITASVLMIPSVIFSEATISYLGLGLTNLNSFGVILSSNQQYIQTHSALIVFPAAIMALLMISFNLFGNGLRDAFNPSLKGSE